MNKKQGFTLVELIVVITILAILGTIAFISFQGYSRDARDSVRISDLANIKKALEVHKTSAGTYPLPTDLDNVYYSGAVAWAQGTVGDSVITNLNTLSKKPVDPLTGTEYTYSVTNTRKEYEVASIMEGDLVSSNLITPTYAAVEAYAFVNGTYNGKTVRVNTGSVDYILAVPTIIATEIQSGWSLLDLINLGKLVFNGYKNLPASYAGTSLELNGGFNYFPEGDIVVFSGSIEDLKNVSEQVIFIQNLQNSYSGTLLQYDPTYYEVANIPIDVGSPSNETIAVAAMNINQITSLDLEVPLYTSSLPPLSEVSGVVVENGGGGEEENLTVKSLSDCSVEGEILYTTIDGTDIGLTCSDDIIVCSGSGTGYIMSACNVGSTEVGIGNNSYGQYFQWGRNKGFTYPVTQESSQIPNASYDPNNDTYGFVWNSNLDTLRYDWIVDQDDDLWGNIADTNEARQGPCIVGYHVPTKAEWDGLVTAGGWGSDGVSMQNSLKLPYSGVIFRIDGVRNYSGTHGFYRNSSTSGSSSSYLIFSSSTINTGITGGRAYGESIRCFKNPEVQLPLTQAEVDELNTLTSQSLTIEQWLAVTSIDLSGQSLTSIPSGVFDLTALTTLNFSNNSLVAYGGDLSTLDSLISLDLSNNGLTSIGTEVTNLTSLINLNLSSNSLSNLPSSITNLTNLTSLNLSSNTSLGYLSTSFNTSSSELYQIGIPTASEIMHISGNGITIDITITTSPLTQAEVDQLNTLTSQSLTIEQWLAVTSIDLSGQSLTSIPSGVFDLTSLTTLNFSNNSLVAYGGDLSTLASLINLDLSSNGLTSIGTEITSLTGLVSLNLSSNSLTNLPTELINLTSLTALDLSGNTSLGNLSATFNVNSTELSQLDIPTAGSTMAISGNGTTIDIIVTSDSTPPVLTNLLPTGTSSSSPVTLSVTSDENASCKYDTTAQVHTYDTMPYTFSTTGGTIHTQSYTPAEGSNSIQLICKDGNNNETITHVITFTYELPLATVNFTQADNINYTCTNCY